MIERIEWLGHASFRIQGPPLIYIDPWRVARTAFHPDVILVSHDHYDHCSPADVEKLRGPNTVVLTNKVAASQFPGAQVLRPWQVYNVDRVCIRALPAYNAQHPQSDEGLSFVIAVDHHDILYAGDTGLNPDLLRQRPDIAILPISGQGTLSVDEAVEAVRQMRPRWVLPSHWGNPTEGASLLEVKAFMKGVGTLAEVVVPEQVR